MSTRDWLKFTLLGVIWGSSFLWIKIGLREVGPLTLVTYRAASAALGLGIFLLLNRRLNLRWSHLLPFFILGVVNAAVPFALITWAELTITSGMASILNSTSPLWVILLGPLFLADEKVTWARTAGLLLGFAGVVVLMMRSLNGAVSPLPGVAAMLVATFCYALGAIFIRKNKAELSTEMRVFGQFSTAALVMLPAAALFEPPFEIPALPLTWTALLWLGLLGSALASILYFDLIKSAGPTRALLVTYIFPLVGVILGAIFLQESVSINLVIGGAMILAGIWIVNQGLPFGLAKKELS